MTNKLSNHLYLKGFMICSGSMNRGLNNDLSPLKSIKNRDGQESLDDGSASQCEMCL